MPERLHGSIRNARRAGPQAAARATAAMANTAEPITTGSRELAWYTMLASTPDPAVPKASPAAAPRDHQRACAGEDQP